MNARKQVADTNANMRGWRERERDSIARLVAKAHFIVGAPEVDNDLVNNIIRWAPTSGALSSLVDVLNTFRSATLQHRQEPQRRKRPNTAQTASRAGASAGAAATADGTFTTL